MSLAEVSPQFLKQDTPGLKKRWFADEDLDLTVWENASRKVMHLQLVIAGRDIVDWQRGRSLRVGIVDSSRGIASDASPTWVFRSEPDDQTLEHAAEVFKAGSGEVEHAIRHVLLQALAGEREDDDPGDEPIDAFTPPPVADASCPAAAPVPGVVESRVVTIALKTPHQIYRSLLDSGAEGWDLCAAGSNHALLQRCAPVESLDVCYDIRSITLYLPHQIKKLLNARGIEGRALRGIGPNFAFLRRARNRPLEPREYDLDSVTLRSMPAITELLERRAADGWGLCGMGANFAFFERFPDRSRSWQHRSVACNLMSISSRTAARVVTLMDEYSLERWSPCAVSSRHIFFRRPESRDRVPAARGT